MNFRGRAKKLDDIDLPRVGARIGVGEDEIHALLSVEAAGAGFDRLGRPKMLFEPHIFYRELGPGPARNAAVSAGLARTRWKRDYPKDSYPRLTKAIALCERFGVSIEKALRAASWGLAQVMGFNHELAGFASAKTMVTMFMDDEEYQLEGMVNYITRTGLADELRRHDWKGFARGYNGPGFAQNRYDKKLADAYARWQKIKDTPYNPVPRSPAPPRDVPGKVTTPAVAAGVGALAAFLYATACEWPWIVKLFGMTCGG